jgi:hypothetical protein
MIQTLEAVFDGEVFRPDFPIAVKANTRVRLVIEPMPEKAGKAASFLHTARSLKLDGPADWADNVDAYLYGEESRRGE